jgi:mRNA interferase RelE/StbE
VAPTASVCIKPSAAKELEALPVKDRTRVVARIRRLATEPRPPGCERLSGDEKYRLRQGDYRILYSIDADTLSVLIVKIGHRREVYR